MSVFSFSNLCLCVKISKACFQGVNARKDWVEEETSRQRLTPIPFLLLPPLHRACSAKSPVTFVSRHPPYLSKIDAAVAMIVAADTFAVEERTYLHPFLHCLHIPGGQLVEARKIALSVEREPDVAAGFPSFEYAVVEAGPPASVVGVETGPPESAEAGPFASAVVEAGQFASAPGAGSSASAVVEAGQVAAESFEAAAVAAALKTAEKSPADGTPPVRHLRNALV